MSERQSKNSVRESKHCVSRETSALRREESAMKEQSGERTNPGPGDCTNMRRTAGSACCAVDL